MADGQAQTVTVHCQQIHVKSWKLSMGIRFLKSRPNVLIQTESSWSFWTTKGVTLQHRIGNNLNRICPAEVTILMFLIPCLHLEFLVACTLLTVLISMPFTKALPPTPFPNTKVLLKGHSKFQSLFKQSNLDTFYPNAMCLLERVWEREHAFHLQKGPWSCLFSNKSYSFFILCSIGTARSNHSQLLK